MSDHETVLDNVERISILERKITVLEDRVKTLESEMRSVILNEEEE